MDDTQQTAQPQDMTAPSTDGLNSMNDVAGMTPPPAPVQMDPATPAMPEPAVDQPAAAMPSEPMQQATPAAGEGTQDDYSYAEDVLNEILDGLDRIEAKLEAMEKKMG